MKAFLGSTQEFNQFLQTGKPTSRALDSDRSAGARPASATRSRLSATTKASAESKATRSLHNVNSQDFVVANTLKYIDKANSSRSLSARNGRRGMANTENIQAMDKEEDSTPFRFVHSWKAYVEPRPVLSTGPRDRLAVRMPEIERTEREVGEEAGPRSPLRRELQIVQSPFRGLRKAALLSLSPNKLKDSRGSYEGESDSPLPSPARAPPRPLAPPHPSYPLTLFPSLSEEDALRRHRLVLLKRCVKLWAGYAQALLRREGQFTKQILRNRNTFLLRRIFHVWRTEKQAVVFYEYLVYDRCKKYWRDWRERRRRRRRGEERASRHYVQRKRRESLLHLLSLARRSRRKRERRERVERVKRRGRERRMERVWKKWREIIKKREEKRRLEREHEERQAKISSFVSSLSHQKEQSREERRAPSRGRLPPNPPPLPPRAKVREVEKGVASLSLQEKREEKKGERGERTGEEKGEGRGLSSSLSSLPPPPYEELEAGGERGQTGEGREREEKKAGERGKSYEERAKSHRERQQELQERARERVRERQAEEERKREAKLRKEEAELLLLQAEQKKKREEEKRRRTQPPSSSLPPALLLPLLTKARTHYERGLLLSSLSPWRRLVEERRERGERGREHRERKVKGRALLSWRGVVSLQRMEREKKERRDSSLAYAFRRRRVLSLLFSVWRREVKKAKLKMIVLARGWEERRVQRKGLLSWKIAYEQRRRRREQREREAYRRGRRVRLKLWLGRWREGMEEQREEREVQRRVESQWARVKTWMKK